MYRHVAIDYCHLTQELANAPVQHVSLDTLNEAQMLAKERRLEVWLKQNELNLNLMFCSIKRLVKDLPRSGAKQQMRGKGESSMKIL